MDKQIYEIAKDLAKISGEYLANCADSCDTCPYGNCRGKFALELYNAGYRKIPEGAVVLTQGEYKSMRMLADECKKRRWEDANEIAIPQSPPLLEERKKDIVPLLTEGELLKLISSMWYKSLHDLATEAKVPYRFVMRAIRCQKIPEEYTRRLTEFLNSL